MSILDQIRIAQRDAGEAACTRNLERMGLVSLKTTEVQELDLRGQLAAKLSCWHRLNEQESDELVALFAAASSPARTDPA